MTNKRNVHYTAVHAPVTPSECSGPCDEINGMYRTCDDTTGGVPVT